MIGGTKDEFYTAELFEGTAAGVRDGRLQLYDGWGHIRTTSSATPAKLAREFLLG